MLTLHQWIGVLVIAACLVAGVVALVARRREPRGGIVPNLIALAQTLVAAQIGIGLLLIADDQRASERMHYAYGVFALLALLAPFLYAPNDPRTRLLWFGVAALVAAALAGRAYMTAG
jgi:drug/metabolite transporter (DMT)-like permease